MHQAQWIPYRMATSHKADLDERIRQPPLLLTIALSIHSILLHHRAPLVHMVVPVLMAVLMPMLVAVLMTAPIPMRVLMAVLMLMGLAVAVAVGGLMCRALPLLRDEAAAALRFLELALQLLLGGRLQPGLQQAVGCSPKQASDLQLMQATARATKRHHSWRMSMVSH